MVDRLLDSLLRFVLKHRRNKVFRGMDANAIREELATTPLVYATDTQGNVLGLVVYEPNPKTQTLFIKRLLTITKGVVREFLAKAKAWFPGYTLEARRYERHTVYQNTPRFMHLLERLS
jgi:hypothetical protein